MNGFTIYREYFDLVTNVLLTISLDISCDLWDILSNVQEF